MSIIKTPAIILKTDNYREASKIVTLFTRSHGKLRTIAKGVRNAKSRWGGVLQSMAYVEAILYFKETRTLHLLSGADYIQTFTNIYSNNQKIELGYRIIELANKATFDNHESKALFNLLVEVLRNIDSATKNYVNLLFNYEFKLARILGFEVDMNTIKKLSDFLTKKSIDSRFRNSYYYQQSTPIEPKFGNSAVFEKQKGSGKPVGSIVESLSTGNFEEVTGFNILKPEVSVLDNFFEKYFEDHLDNINFSKTKRVFGSKEMNI